MTISEYIKSFKGISADEVREKFKQEFLNGVEYSNDEQSILSAFCASKTKMNEDNTVRSWTFKNLNDIYKDLGQVDNEGGFKNTNQIKALTVVDDQINNFRKKIVGYIEQGVSVKKKKLTVPQKDIEKFIFDKNINVDLVKNSALDHIVDEKTINEYNSADTKNYLRDVYVSREVIAELATFLAIESGVFKSIKSDYMVKQQRAKISQAIKNVIDISKKNNVSTPSVSFIKRISCKLAAKADPIVKPELFKLSQLKTIIETKVDKFQNIALAFASDGESGETSNYNIGILDEYGDKSEFVDYEDATWENIYEDNIFKAIDGVKALAGEIVNSDKFDHTGKNLLVNYREGALLSIIMLAVAETFSVQSEISNYLKQIYAPVLAQCLDNLTKDEINKTVEDAEEIVSNLEIKSLAVDDRKIRKEDSAVSENDSYEDLANIIGEEIIGESAIVFDSKYMSDKASSVNKVAKSSKIGIKQEAKIFREKLVDAIERKEKTQGLYNKRAVKKENPERQNGFYVKNVLSMKQIGLNKNFNNFKQSIDELLEELPVEAKNAPAVSRVLEKLYEELYGRVLQLMNKSISGAEYTNEEKNLIREKYGLTETDATDIVNDIYSEVFNDDGSVKPDYSTSDSFRVL